MIIPNQFTYVTQIVFNISHCKWINLLGQQPMLKKFEKKKRVELNFIYICQELCSGYACWTGFQ